MMEHLLYFQTLRGLRFAATTFGTMTMEQTCFVKSLDSKMERFTQRNIHQVDTNSRIHKMHLELGNATLETRPLQGVGVVAMITSWVADVSTMMRQIAIKVKMLE